MVESGEQEKQVYASEYSNKIILADKPLDMTSADVLNILKRKLKIKKAGHAGTLDPRATGLLVICTDKYTKRINEFIDFDKEYEGVIKIGVKTPSYDTETDEYDMKDVSSITDEDIQKAGKRFMGEILQVPPMHSAIKVKGKRLYKLAHKGKNIEREPRKVFVKRFDLKRIGENEISFNIECSKGTYIRSIANDLGERLGVGGYLRELRRTRVGDFHLSDLDKSEGKIKFKVLT